MSTTWTSEYQPYEQQMHFHASAAVNKLFLAGIGAGKTLTGLHEFLWACEENDRSDGMIVAPTYPMLRDVILTTWEDWVHPSLYQLKKGSNCIEYHTGRRIFLRTATHPDRIRGPNIGHAWFDEPAMVISRRPWDILSGRVRCPRARRRSVIATTTPRGFNWLAKIFARGGKNYHLTRARTRDNIHLPDDYESGLRALYGEDFAAQELDANIVDMAGIAWPIYGSVHLRLSLTQMLERRIHTFFGGVDWGYTNPAALVVGGLDYDGRWYIVATWYKRGKRREEIAEAAAKLTKQWNVRHWYADHDPEGNDAMRAKGLSVVQAEKDVIAGVQHVRSLVAVRGDGEPRVYINPELRDWLREQEGYQFPQHEDGRYSEKDEEPVGTNGNHLMDASRYMTYTNSLTWVQGTSYRSVERPRFARQSHDWGGA